jgi:hypothetical protein
MTAAARQRALADLNRGVDRSPENGGTLLETGPPVSRPSFSGGQEIGPPPVRQDSIPKPEAPMSEVESRQERLARNQILFRVVNERVVELKKTATATLETDMYICECARPTCIEPVELTAEEYDEVRRHTRRFIVAPSNEHVFPEVEQVVHRTDRFYVVEKASLPAI